MALYYIIISVYEPPGNVSPISPSPSSEGELHVLFPLFTPPILSPSSSLLMAGNRADGLDALFMCGI